MYLAHDVVLALHVYVAGGLVEDVDLAVVQQRAGERQALALSSGEVGRALGELRVQAVLAAQEVREVHALQHLPKLGVGRVRLAHQQIRAHAAFEKVAPVAYIGHGAHQAALVYLGQLRAAHGDRAGVVLIPAHEYGRDGALAAAALSDHGGEAAAREAHVHAVQYLALRLVGKAQIPALYRAAGRHSPGLRLRLGQIQQAEYLVARRHAVHGYVEIAAQQAHGDEEVRRQQYYQKAAVRPYFPARELRRRQYDAQRRAAVGDEIHDGDGVELHREDFHRYLAKALRLLVHLLLLELVRLVYLQRRQPLQILQEGVPQRRVLTPVFAKQLLRPALHRHYRHGDERHADKQHRGAQHADRAEHGEQRQRCEHGVEELRQICAEVRLQLVDALDGHLHHLGGVGLLAVGRAQAQQLFVYQPAQRALDSARREIAHPARERGTYVAHDHRRQRHGERHGYLVRRRLALEQPRQQARDARHHRYVRRQRHPLAGHVARYVLPALADGADQPLVYHHAQ